MRKDAEFSLIKRDLIGDVECGSITRQELVSMVPPLCLETTKAAATLDLCAAPGLSYTSTKSRLKKRIIFDFLVCGWICVHMCLFHSRQTERGCSTLR